MGNLENFMEKLEKVNKEKFDELNNLFKEIRDELRKLEEEIAKILKERASLRVEMPLSAVTPEGIVKILKEQVSFAWKREECYITLDDLGDYLYGDERYKDFVDMLNCPEYRELVIKIIKSAKEDVVFIVGPSGSGKTSLLYFIGKFLEENGGKYSYIYKGELPSDWSLDSYHADEGIYLFLNDPTYDEFRRVYSSSYKKYVIIAVRDQVLESYLSRYWDEIYRDRGTMEELVDDVYKRAVTVEYDEARKYLEHLANSLFRGADPEAVKIVIEKAKSSWHGGGRDRISPSLYYVKFLHEDLKKRGLKLTSRVAEEIPESLLYLEASALCRLYGHDLNREYRTLKERRDVYRAASILIPLASLAIHGRLPRYLFDVLMEKTREFLSKAWRHEEKLDLDGYQGRIWDFVTYKSENYVGFPHDSWRILLKNYVGFPDDWKWLLGTTPLNEHSKRTYNFA